MATGILELSPFAVNHAGLSLSIVNAIERIVGGIGLPSEAMYGDWTSNLPVEIGGYEWDGLKVPTFLDDYYYRFHLTPATVEFGYILSPTVETFYLWNAYFVSKDCTAINQINGDEYALSGLTAPFTLSGLEEIMYTVTAPLEGAADFESSIDFDFGVDDDYVLVTLTGTRIVLFAFCPLQPMTEYLEWLTDIITAKDGSEQRISVRRTPRQGYTFSIYMDSHQQQARLDALLFTWQKKAWGLPIWTDWVVHTATIAAGASTITVDTTNADFRDDGMAVIWKSLTEYEVIRIDTVAAGSLTLSSNVQSTFTGSKYIIPVRVAQMNTPVERKDAPDGYSMAEFNFVVKNNVLFDDYTPATTYPFDGMPVLTKATYAGEGQERVSDGDIVISDYNTGQFLLYSDSDYNRETQSHIFKNRTKAQAWDHRMFLHSLIGRLNHVWIPSFKNDMILTATIGDSETNFTVENIGLSDNMGLNSLRTHLAFVYPDGTMLLRQITGISEVDDTEEQISIGVALGVEIEVGDVMICFLDKYRLSDDKVDIEWEHMGWNDNELEWVRIKQ